MRGGQSSGVVYVVPAPPLIDGSVVAQLELDSGDDAREIVLDVSAATQIDAEAVELLAWLAQNLENAGGKFTVTARRAPDDTRVTRTLRTGDLTRALGVHPVLDKAIMRQLTAGAGGAAPW